ncbi:MAG: endonuclease/exonuclease/phosphatase family protein [Phycisphaeraceae bacterium]|nr:MAG: endonuclease/exonuclease/phosphatase family protein [Phycisphaeraceae bacterium]
MKLLTWNIMHGGGPERLCWIGLALLDWAPDVIALTEFRARRGGSLRGVLADHGWMHQALSQASPDENGVLLASRKPLSNIDTHAALPGPLRRRIVSAEVAGGSVGDAELLAVTAVHVPDAARHDRTAMVGKSAVWHELIRVARARRDGAHAIVGDLNTGRHRLDEAGETFSCTALMGRIMSLGYVDAWRNVHDRRREGSWFSSSGGAFRIDHALVSGPLAGRIASAEYGQNALGKGLSDHAPLLVELAEGAPKPENAGFLTPAWQKTLEK